MPILALLLYARPSPARTWASAAVAFAGTALLSFDGSPPNVGDAWSVSAAVASAMFILRLEQVGQGKDPAQLNAATLVCAAAAFGVWAAADVLWFARGAADVPPAAAAAERAAELGVVLGEHWPSVLYLAVVTTFVAQWLQALGQASVGAQDAAIIYALDPVYGAGFSYLLLGEQLGATGLAGGALVLAAVGLSRGGGGNKTPPGGDGGGSGGEDVKLK